MEYIKKEELIIGEIYKADNGSLTYIMKATKDLENVKNIPEYCEFMKHGCFNGSDLTFTNATSEEKHWLNTCIKQYKFITFEEAMKTFIPEYVEWIDNIGSSNLGYQTSYHFKKNKIFKTDVELPSHGLQTQNWITHLKIYPNNYKPSTKEAYDAQFVVKEPEFVLPEKWYIKTTEETFDIIRNWAIQQANFPNYKEYVHHLKVSFNYNGKYREIMNCAEITFEQFKKYVLKEEIVEEKVIEPLPQFKIIETIETITKVENNEGNQFFINDKIKVSLNMVQKIISFSYNEDKTEIFANFNQNLSISINDIEHYIEPKVEETLLEKAKRLYPVGTKFINPNGNRECVIKEKGSYFEGNNHNIYHSIANGVFKYEEGLSGCIYINNTWSKIIE